MSYDCFFSYQHDDLALVEAIAARLEDKGLVCWYAPRNVKGRYAKAIAEGISNSKVFVLILNNRSAISEAVLNEVELAHNVSKTSPNAVIQPVCSHRGEGVEHHINAGFTKCLCVGNGVTDGNGDITVG